MIASMRKGPVLRQLQNLLDQGSGVGITDGQLLERFAIARDERAFEARWIGWGRWFWGVAGGF